MSNKPKVKNMLYAVGSKDGLVGLMGDRGMLDVVDFGAPVG